MRALLLFLLCGFTACSASRVIDRDDAGRPILLAGPQPDEHSLPRTYEFYGVKTVLNLRGPSPGEWWYESEKRGVSAIDANWVQLRTSGYKVPSDEHVAAFFDTVENPANRPVFMHCQSGIHRTGLMTALYRIQYQGWTADRAIDELYRNGFQLGFKDRSAVVEFIRSYRPDPNRTMSRGDVPSAPSR